MYEDGKIMLPHVNVFPSLSWRVVRKFILQC